MLSGVLYRFREGMGLTSQEVVAFEDYFYHIMAARGSGEHALRHLLAPFARAKHPLEGRLHELKVFPACPLAAGLWGESPRLAASTCDHVVQTSPAQSCAIQRGLSGEVRAGLTHVHELLA